MAAMQRAQFTGLALIDGAVGLAMAPYGRLRVVLTFTITDGLITDIDRRTRAAQPPRPRSPRHLTALPTDTATRSFEHSQRAALSAR
jgi:hypothetical protein